MTVYSNVLCVGMHFRGQAIVDLVSLLEPGTTLGLVREPENQYDAYALMVMFEGQHIGYVERGQAAWISPIIDEGATATAVITGFLQKGKNKHPVLEITTFDASEGDGSEFDGDDDEVRVEALDDEDDEG